MSSGYFSAPSKELDPNLFDGETLRAEVASSIVAQLFNALKQEGFKDPQKWTHVWIAGSSITYQWAADRGNGDIDVLFGIDIPKFALANAGYEHYGEDTLATMMNTYLKATLWPATASTKFGERTYELTFYINPGTETDIRHIHPYAAYDVIKDEWVVRPPELPADPSTLYPAEWFDYAAFDQVASDALRRRYDAAQADLGAMPVGSPGYHDAGARINLTAAQAQAQFADIHVGRREAFQGVSGKGYGDWNNFRWQQAKASGVLETLHQMIAGQDAEREQSDTRLYGGPIAGADELIRRAQERYR